MPLASSAGILNLNRLLWVLVILSVSSGLVISYVSPFTSSSPFLLQATLVAGKPAVAHLTIDGSSEMRSIAVILNFSASVCVHYIVYTLF